MFIRVTEVFQENQHIAPSYRNVTINVDHISCYRPSENGRLTQLVVNQGKETHTLLVRESTDVLDELLDSEGLFTDGAETEDEIWDHEDQELNVMAGLFSSDFSLYLSRNESNGHYIVEVKNDQETGNLKEVHSSNAHDLVTLMERYCKKLVDDVKAYVSSERNKERKPTKRPHIRLLKTPAATEDDEKHL